MDFDYALIQPVLYVPTDQAEHCSFRPRITPAAHSRRSRTADEMSRGDLQAPIAMITV